MNAISSKLKQIDEHTKKGDTLRARVHIGELAQQFCDESTWAIRLEAVMKLREREDEVADFAREDMKYFAARLAQVIVND